MIEDRIISEDFQRLTYYLDSGFNLLIYGVGSKFRLINQFVREKIQSGGDPILQVQGYHSGTNLIVILQSII